MTRELRIIPKKGLVFGVCAGIAYWLRLPEFVVRIIFSIGLIFGGGIGSVLYLLLWLLIPKLEEVPETDEAAYAYMVERLKKRSDPGGILRR